MKTVKVHFVGFWIGFENDNNMFYNILKKRYNVVLDDKDPDFLICSPLGTPFEYMKFDCPRIMYTGEPLSADFNAVDYFIGFDDLSFGDRSFRFPLFLYNNDCVHPSAKPLTRDEAARELATKEHFCNYIYGHNDRLGVREKMLEALSSYKHVVCAGSHHNNMPNGERVNIENKFTLMSKCKFSIAVESIRYPGFTSEKIAHAFRTRTVPIYFGDPDVTKCFRASAFIDYAGFDSAQAMAERVMEIDRDDDLYIEMLCQNRYVVEDYETKMAEGLAQYLYHIFDQDKEEAYRRPRFFRAAHHESYLKDFNRMQTSFPHRVLRKLKL